MNIKAITSSAKGLINKSTWFIQKHAPEILITLGVTGTIAGVITACVATRKVDPIIEEHNEKLESIKQSEKLSDGEIVEAEPGETVTLTTETRLSVYTKTAFQLVKVYAPSAFIIGMSLGSMVWSNQILRNRLGLAAAAYAALADKFDTYRKRVRESYGEEEDERCYTGVTKKEVIEVTDEVDEDGNPITVTKTVTISDDDDYTALFDETSTKWERDNEQNLYFLMSAQNYLNHLLKGRSGKPVFLNEVREYVGLPRTEVGQVVGWTYSKDANHKGDNFIDFGIGNIYTAYKNGEEVPFDMSYLLSFNVDGNVMYAL